MPAYALIDADGYPFGAGEHPTHVPDGAVPLGHPEDLKRLATLRWLDGRWSERPVLRAPDVDEGAVFFDLLPAEAQISLTDAITGDPIKTPAPTAGFPLLRLPKGSYHLRITAPNPWVDIDQLIDVDGGSPQRMVDALMNAKRAARDRVNAAAGRARLALVTDIPGQQAIYQAKEAEARAWMAALPLTLTDYPLLAAEVGITAPNAAQLAQLWLNMGHMFRAAAAQSEGARMTALAAIDAAKTPEELHAR